ncbi:MAG TPA: PadR family transcriptional regulator [Herpetosiphonaceae bacterium]|nr:PadR family transcriptional regulator [Herpetosiphonaceae bacterium]
MPMHKGPLTIEHAALGLLRQRPMHAYEMHQSLRRPDALGLVWRLKQSLLYAILERLEGEGYLAAEVVPQGNRPPRRLLSLTPLGADAIARWLGSPVAHGRDFRIEFLAKLYFARQDGPAAVAALLTVQRQACQGWLRDLHGQAAAAADRMYEWLVLQFRIGQIEATMAWLDTCSATLAPAPR